LKEDYRLTLYETRVQVEVFRPKGVEVSFSKAVQSFVGPWSLYNFLVLYTVSGTSWTGDQLVARPLSILRATQTE
jgi:hypothetical protein